MIPLALEMPKVSCAFEGCKKKLDLVAQGLTCKCQKAFCGVHRGMEDHGCTVDTQPAARAELLKYMSSPVVAKKIEVI
jgi:hypothetical protein